MKTDAEQGVRHNEGNYNLPPHEVGKDVAVLLETAAAYQAAGYSVIVVDADKRAVNEWKDAQSGHLPLEQLERDLRHRRAKGLAVVSGAVSGGLVVLDFDADKDGRACAPFDLESEFVSPWLEAIKDHVDPDTLPRQRTPSGGWQFYFRCPPMGGNTKLAGVQAWKKQDGEVVVGELARAPHYAIETRGEGGYAVIPTPGSSRVWESDLNLIHAPYLEAATTEAMLDVARALDQTAPATPKPAPSPKPARAPLGDGESVIAAYNDRHTVEELLERNGYRQQANNRWLAPDSSSGIAGISVRDGRMYSHHASDPLGDGHAHDAFDICCVLEHNSDVSAAVKAAAAELGLNRPSYRGARVAPRPAENGGAAGPDLTDYNRTDYGNAERLHALYGKRFRHSDALGHLVWDGRHWRVDENDKAMQRLALETARALFAQAAVLEGDSREVWVKHALACERSAGLKNAVDMVKTIPGVAIDVGELDADPALLNVHNGTINLRDGTIRAHDPKDLITKLAPVEYDPEAGCPRWLEFQSTICEGDDELLKFKQRAHGYSLTGLTSEDVLFIAYGSGANGKSTELTVMGELLGDYANTAQFDTFAVKKSEGIRNDIADLMGSRFVSASEGENRQRLAEGLVKQMTGGDVLKARFLHKEYFRFKPTFKLWLATNHKPVIRGTDEGIWRRIRLIPYTVTIPLEQRDKGLRAKLEAERSGILNWLLSGCEAWYKHGLGTARAVTAATDSYRQESDALAEFIAARCVTGDEYAEVSGDLYRAYTTWCSESMEDAFTSNLFGRMLTERGYTVVQARVNGKSTKVRTGICLFENADTLKGGLPS